MSIKNRTKVLFLLAAITFISLITILGCSKTDVQEIAAKPSPTVTQTDATEESVETVSTIEATDALGRVVSLSHVPERIVAAGRATMIVADALYLFPEARSHVVGLGMTNQGLGDFYSYLAPEFPSTKRMNHHAGVEEIVSYNPDLVLLKSSMYESLGKKLEQLNIPVFILNLESPDDYIKEISQLGMLLQEQKRAEEIVSYYQRMMKTVSDAMADISLEDRPTVLMLYCSVKDGVTAFKAAPKDWIQTFMTEAAGGDPIWKESNTTKGWKTINFEQVAAWDPDRIYIISYRAPATKFLEEIESTPAWHDLRAYKHGAIKAFPADFHNWAQPDTRWILGLTWLSFDLFPDLYAGTDFISILKDFYQGMYGIEDDMIIQDIIDRYEASLH